MNWTLVRSFLSQRFRSRGRMFLLFVCVASGVGKTWLQPWNFDGVVGSGVLIALVIGTGMIGRDVSSGAAQLILSRPVRKFDYVASRYVATCLGAFAVCGVELGAALTAAAHAGGHASPIEVAGVATAMLSWAVTTASVLVLVSGMGRGIADLGGYVGLIVIQPLLELLDLRAGQHWAGRLGDALDWVVLFYIRDFEVVTGGIVLVKALLHQLAIIVGCVALAYACFRRRELSYSD